MPRVQPPEPAPHAAPAPDEIDLLAYVATAWRYKYVLLALVVIVGAVTYFINMRITPTYEVNFRLLASASMVGDTSAQEVNVTAFRELLASQSLAAALLDDFKLTAPPYNLTPRSFLADHVSVRLIPATTMINVSVRLTDPALLVKVANRYAERVIDLAERLNSGDAEYAREGIKEELDASLVRLTAAEEALRAFQQRTQIELLRADVDAMLMRRPEAVDLTVQIEAERARLKQAEIELAGQERVRDVARAITSVEPLRQPEPLSERRDPRFDAGRRVGLPAAELPKGQSRERELKGQETTEGRPQAERRAQEPVPRPLDPVFRPELMNPYVNPVYEVLQRDVADARTRLAGLEEQRKEVVSRLNMDASGRGVLNRLYDAESDLASLTRNYDIARTAYLNAATRHEEARLQVTVRSARLQILDRALPPDSPVAPRVLRNVAAAVLIALTLGLLGVLAFDASRQRSVA